MAQTKRHVAVYVTGGIAVYKAAMVVRGLMKAGMTVRVALTPAATKFVTPLTFAALTKTPVLTDLFAKENEATIPHIELADWTDVAVVVPATANIIAKMATGLADEVVSTSLLATTAPKIVVPAMNEHMWLAKATQRNVSLLEQDGVTVMAPAAGALAEGYAGLGRLPEPDEIVTFIGDQMHESGPLAGDQIMVTAGGTKERLDPVRYLGNDSSGKMGYAVATAAARAGATVTLISTVTRPIVPGVEVVPVTTAAEMLAAMDARFDDQDAVVMAAAVADFRPATTASQKIKKVPGEDALTLQLVKNPDLLKTLAAKRTHQVMVGFAAETQNLLANATAKLTGKHLDLLVANDVSRPESGFNADDNQATLLMPNQAPLVLPLMPKSALAEKIIEQVATLVHDKKR
ncbi:bifunctional phosphopantothenoylcysteine decarboxylase/phosphopantothenate--cysteine ligase CoaBC [Furfurilactobacillus entadae]|uniref:bifunctional phosphopantothenoylcysteine decarboxylase/phosphopantothenate--cysteine ligase CoaBC n=1 Tax=Furfurilactobacillus entadae TaxID=2922307 RepID=UPI0035EA7C18